MAGGIQTQGARGTHTTLSEINVTPLVDVMLVLLIIFMVVAPKLEKGVSVKLPTLPANEIQAISIDEDLIVAIEADGSVHVGDLKVPTDKLATVLAAIVEQRNDKAVYLKGDHRVPYGRVVAVMGAVRAAGVTEIGMIAEPQKND